ncbi:MAG: membrane associated rhomboid family serine protease [Flavobacteriaceae bacterium]|jgi:membrane associated rhomboid family serine protease
MAINILIIIIVIIVGFSLKGFSDNGFLNKLMYIPYLCKNEKQYYRAFTHIFIHGDMGHLIFNMMSLYFLGDALLTMEGGFYTSGNNPEVFELAGGFIHMYGNIGGQVHFFALFVLGGLFATVIPYMRNKDNQEYRSLGASGAVSAVIFAAILWNPTMELNIMFIPIGIPAYIFGPLYLAYEFYADKRGNSGIAHDAHIGGAIFGILYVLIINIDKGKELVQLIF